jgi:hypothetical protein
VSRRVGAAGYSPRMAHTIHDKDHWRSAFLRRLYDLTGASPRIRAVDPEEVGRGLEIPPKELSNVVQYLHDSGAVEWHGIGGIGITASGVRWVENELRRGA